MNNHELKMCRKLLFLSEKEAARYIGKVSARTWQRWEGGEYCIPKDVEEKTISLLRIRDSLIRGQIKTLELFGMFPENTTYTAKPDGSLCCTSTEGDTKDIKADPKYVYFLVYESAIAHRLSFNILSEKGK